MSVIFVQEGFSSTIVRGGLLHSVGVGHNIARVRCRAPLPGSVWRRLACRAPSNAWARDHAVQEKYRKLPVTVVSHYVDRMESNRPRLLTSATGRAEKNQ